LATPATVERGRSREAVRLLRLLRIMSLRRAKGEASPLRPVGELL
jgi:hypothetical protein